MYFIEFEELFVEIKAGMLLRKVIWKGFIVEGVLMAVLIRIREW